MSGEEPEKLPKKIRNRLREGEEVLLVTRQEDSTMLWVLGILLTIFVFAGLANVSDGGVILSLLVMGVLAIPMAGLILGMWIFKQETYVATSLRIIKSSPGSWNEVALTKIVRFRVMAKGGKKDKGALFFQRLDKPLLGLSNEDAVSWGSISDVKVTAARIKEIIAKVNPECLDDQDEPLGGSTEPESAADSPAVDDPWADVDPWLNADPDDPRLTLLASQVKKNERLLLMASTVKVGRLKKSLITMGVMVVIMVPLYGYLIYAGVCGIFTAIIGIVIALIISPFLGMLESGNRYAITDKRILLQTGSVMTAPVLWQGPIEKIVKIEAKDSWIYRNYLGEALVFHVRDKAIRNHLGMQWAQLNWAGIGDAKALKARVVPVLKRIRAEKAAERAQGEEGAQADHGSVKDPDLVDASGGIEPPV